jgi:hypothetical protein
MLFFRHKLSS